ncbi:hypothetical protein ABAC402_04695 [Asticcacaulis sp. AC402]|nr:hypothetical protein ABAC402_04695 [Asticcacaulis sp. AC402]
MLFAVGFNGKKKKPEQLPGLLSLVMVGVLKKAKTTTLLLAPG